MEQSKIRAEELDFTYFITYEDSDDVFASARDRAGNGHSFIIKEQGVMAQSGSAFQYVPPAVSEQIRKRSDLFFHKVPVFKKPNYEF